jgi:glycogen debranching enzyme
MDNQPRIPLSESPWHNHGHLSWVDTCFQQLFSADLLARMADVLGRPVEKAVFREEHGRLSAFVNGKMWDDRTAFYHDRRGDGTLNGAKSVGAYWALVADAVPRERLDPFIAHLENPAEFNRPHRVPSLSADHVEYKADGGYWLGAAWPPTTYMVLRGLVRAGREKLAREIALNHHANVVSVFRETGTLFENYAPESAAPGNPSRRDFVGWGGLGPVAVFLEYVLGLVPDVPAGRLTWTVSLVEKHGVSRYPFAGGGIVDLACASRNSLDEKPVIRATSSAPLDLVLRWDGGEETMRLG